jgi:hypothetical protein
VLARLIYCMALEMSEGTKRAQLIHRVNERALFSCFSAGIALSAKNLSLSEL